MSRALQFICTLGIAPHDLRTALRTLQEVGETRNPFENVLISPLFCPPPSLRIVKRMREEGVIKRLYFDSGGYQIQKGLINYWTLYRRLLDFYTINDYADVYVLPDCPPVSADSDELVQRKVRLTVEGSKQFFWDMPAPLRDRALFVMQGREPDHLEYCASNFSALGARAVGFGSFATRGTSDSVNYLNDRSLSSLQFIRRRYPNLDIHCFGVGNPPTAYLLSQLGIASFDSSGWIKSAIYGNIYFPFTRAYNISFRRIERGNTALDYESFGLLKELTGHSCPFCNDYRALASSRTLRFLHNLLCLCETVQEIEQHQRATSLISRWAPSYSKYISRTGG